MQPGIETYREIFKWACLLAACAQGVRFVKRYHARERAGRFLLDLGRINEQRAGRMRAYGAAGILIGLIGVLLCNLDFRWPFFISIALQGVNLVAASSERFLICEAGILSELKRGAPKLIRWRDVLDYNVDNGKVFLNLREKGWVACRPKVRLDYQDELERLLASRYPKPHEPVAVY